MDTRRMTLTPIHVILARAEYPVSLNVRARTVRSLRSVRELHRDARCGVAIRVRNRVQLLVFHTL